MTWAPTPAVEFTSDRSIWLSLRAGKKASRPSRMRDWHGPERRRSTSPVPRKLQCVGGPPAIHTKCFSCKLLPPHPPMSTHAASKQLHPHKIETSGGGVGSVGVSRGVGVCVPRNKGAWLTLTLRSDSVVSTRRATVFAGHGAKGVSALDYWCGALTRRLKIDERAKRSGAREANAQRPGGCGKQLTCVARPLFRRGCGCG